MSLATLNLRHLVSAVELATGQPPRSIPQFGRARPLARARAIFIRAARDRGFTLKAIGAVLGGRDHTTVLHGYRTALKRFTDAEWTSIRTRLDELVTQVREKRNDKCCPTCGQRLPKK